MAKDATASTATPRVNEESRLEMLLRSAAQLGTHYASLAKDEKESRDKTAERRDMLTQDVKQADRKIAGFSSPMFIGMAMVAAEFGKLYNDPNSDSARTASERAAKSFGDTFTNAGDKTAKGGTSAGFAHVIRLGNRAESARRLLQDRLEHWLAVQDEASAMAPGADRNAKMDLARRYTQLAVNVPNAEGKYIGRDGKEGVPKNWGRPACVINDVVIPAAGATDRKALMSAFARLVHDNGDKALTIEVADAWLDNGGKWAPPADQSVNRLAAESLTLIEKLIGAGAGTSPDGFALANIATVLERIAKQGLAVNKAATVQDAPEDESKTDESTTTPESEDESKADESDEPKQGAAIVLGMPNGGTKPASASNKPRVANKRRAGGGGRLA
jgi:hypothetical protein